jgi:hypothetical protein
MSELDWLPNVIIAGAPKAGTSSLHSWIADHPDAFGSIEKETYFFIDPETHAFRPDVHISNGLESYRRLFPIPEQLSPKVILEATPGYLYSKLALRHIPELPSHPKCLFLLREPASQIYSLYTYFRGNWDWIPAEMSFGDFLDAARSGSHGFKGNELARNALVYARYVDHLKPWQDRLGPERMKVLSFDALSQDQLALTKQVAEWIGLDPAFYDSYDFPRENETYQPKVRALQSANIAVRNLLPKGRAYDALRRLYRSLNTTKPSAATDEDAEIIEDLKREFAPHNARLSEAFGLDVRSWT